MYYNSIYQKDLVRICQENIPYCLLREKTVLVTGANGLIGSCIIDTLLKLNELYHYDIQVKALCRNRDKANKRFKIYENHKLFEIITADVTQPLRDKFYYNYIIHAASNAHPLAYAAEPVETMQANIIGTMQLLEYSRMFGIQRFLFISSSEIYGENRDNLQSFGECDMGYINSMNERACYPESKRAAETLCASYTKQYNIDTVVARPGYVYGMAMNDSNTRADIQFIQSALRGEDIIMKSSGSQVRSYCYLSDAISGIFYILLLGEKKEAYNIANKDCNVTIAEFAHTLADKAGINVVYDKPSKREKEGYSEIRNAVIDGSKLGKLGWEAKIDLETGINYLLKGLREDNSNF